MYYADKYCQFEKVYGESLDDEDSYTITGNVIEFHKLTRDLIVTNKRYTVKGVLCKDIFRYRQGELIQNCFPYLSITDREFLISGQVDELEENYL